MAEGEHGGAHPRHVAVVVRAPHVDRAVEPALGLVLVVGDVGEKVGVAPVRLAQHAVLVVAVGGGAQPQRTALLEQHAALGERLQRRADAVLVVQPALVEEHVEPHPESREIIALLRLQRLDGERAAHVRPLGRRHVGEPRALHREELVGELDQVGAVVALLGDRRLAAHALLHPRPQRLAEAHDLAPRVVHVELARDRVALPLEQRAHAIAQRRAAPVRHVQRPGRVGRDELDVDRERPLWAPAPVVGAGDDDLAQRLAELRGRQAEVDEAGSRDLDRVHDARREVEGRDDLLGDPARRRPERLRQQHRKVGRDIAVALLARRLQLHGHGTRRPERRGDARQLGPDRILRHR